VQGIGAGAHAYRKARLTVVGELALEPEHVLSQEELHLVQHAFDLGHDLVPEGLELLSEV
jgi:hypothetical protein